MNLLSNLLDTITAVATPIGISAIGIIRISGLRSTYITKKIIKKKKIKKLNFVLFFDNDFIIDKGIVLFFKKPKSFTGENLVEFHVHGNDLIIKYILNIIINLGARLAMPGEFSFRAFYNNKIDLIQAESINLLIKSDIISQNNLIIKSLTGIFSKIFVILINDLVKLKQNFDLYLDFPDDSVFNFNKFKFFFLSFRKKFYNLFNKCYVKNINTYLNILIIGETNVGKSSLFNFLLKKNRSIVFNSLGTTRDFIEDKCYIGNFNFKLIDTAGFSFYIDNIVEKMGIIKTIKQINKSLIIIFMFDVKDNIIINKQLLKKILLKLQITSKVFIIKNKIDLIDCYSCINKNKNFIEIALSVKNIIGINLLSKELSSILNTYNINFIISDRHFNLLIKSKIYIENIFKNIKNENNSPDIYSENLNLLSKIFSEIKGENISDNLINKIFSNFCIGK